MTTRIAAEFFSASYAGAIERFVATCRARGADLQTWLHPLNGPEGEELATHTAYFGPADASDIVIVISGTHGLEGLAGSGCQLALIDELRVLPKSAGYLFIHMLNPWGAAWARRQNEDNIDLNRNFLSFDATSLPGNEDYDSLHDALMRLKKGNADAERRIEEFIADRGYNAYIAALFRGQYTQPQGINFGGMKPAWSNDTLRAILAKYLEPRQSAFVMDLHTGLELYGHGTVISTAEGASPEMSRLRDWLGNDFVSLSGGESSLPYEVAGDLGSGIRQQFASKDLTIVALEFGTYDVTKLVELQIEDCLQLSSQTRTDIRTRLVDFFYPRDEVWFESVTSRTREVVSKILWRFQSDAR